ncbi:hypothetical protein H2204_003695 [Knufia peltigerae]|uniref:protein-ribulosamine 3-kinase n=1 Tax=Knufia peltigerae TaxID=1002370 RepID=A0AA38YAE3_9EURO|nr:hypothetical protein H2204_003695 [Knufia peltigerae]
MSEIDTLVQGTTRALVVGETRTSVKEVIPEVGGTFQLDENVVNVLPPGSKVVQAISYGTAAWTRASRIIIEHPDGEQQSYFLKCATEEMGRIMMEGEHRSMAEIYSYMPDFVPKPVISGKFKQSPPDTYFYLMEFVDLDSEMVEPPDFCRRIAQLHTMSVSPTGLFGFHQVTFHGPNPQNTTWEANWCTYFTRLMTQFFEREINQNGPAPEYEAAFYKFAREVVPQILEPLQSDGRTLKPCLIHGDLWEENTGLNLETELPVVFDAGAMYAHHEMELGMWRADIIRFGKPYMRQYLIHMPPSEPVEQFDDRNRLYGIKYTLSHCLGWPASSQSDREL